ncbi:MAG: HD family phosphohydrolase [Thermodesulfobacteriota bacterium]
MDILQSSKKLRSHIDSGRLFLLLLLTGVTAALILILFPAMSTTRYSYQIGDVAQRDIKANTDFFIEDLEATEANRQQAAEAVLVVYDHDTTLIGNTLQRLSNSFSALRAVMEPASPDESGMETVGAHARVMQAKGLFEEKLGFEISDASYRLLGNDSFSKETETLIGEIVGKILANGVVANKEVLLQELDKGINLRNLETGEERLVQSLKPFYGPDQARAMVRVIGQPLMEQTNPQIKNVVVEIAQRLVLPNITLNLNETKERRKKAALDIKPFLYQIKKGEMILREGERVTEFQLRKLSAMQAHAPEESIITSRLGTALIFICILIVGYVLFLRQHPVFKQDRNKNLLFLSSVLIIFLLVTRISASLAEGLAPSAPFSIQETSMYCAIPLSAAAMTVALFMGINLALPFSMIIAICATVIFNNRFELFLYFLLSSAMGAHWMRHCRERVVFIKAGLKLGLINVLFISVVNVYMADFSAIKFLWDWIFAFLGGLVSGIVTAGIAPLVESAFKYTTDIKLLELVNLDRPILRSMMIEASGTYHHSVIVGSMVEAAAADIGANPLLARACGYYHDIGKIRKPLYFIENQANGRNKHDKLAPSMSSLILISHIKDGVEIAKENKLGQAIIDTIRQHHGTSLISYFYEKAKQIKGEDVVNIDDFRYPGPKPQTREAGLVMLADVIEAASRTLENPTHSRIQGQVQKLVNKIFSEGQLDDCELTLRDLHNIAKSFITILDGIYHNRIEYPESQPSIAGKGKNGHSDRQPAKPGDDGGGEGPAQSASHLKRLGQS